MAEVEKKPDEKKPDSSTPPCMDCGALTIRTGACHTCPVCGSTTGCG